METFDLLQEKWVECALLDGSSSTVGLHGLLASAHEVREVAEPSPLVTFGVYRLLLATAHWLMPIETVKEWRTVWEAGRFPGSLTGDLLKRGKERFDLFNPERPFYQDADIPPPSDKRGKTVGALCLEVPLGTNINHFHHVYDDEHALCPACCARGLVTLPPFAPRRSSKAPYQPSVNGCPPLYVFPQGQSLFHTLMLNLPIREMWREEWTALGGADVPTWQPRTNPHGRADHAIGFLEGLTWQPRQARLGKPDLGQTQCTCCGTSTPLSVKRVAFGNHPAKVGERDWVDPHVPLTAKNKKRMLPNTMQALAWCRQLAALLATPDGADDLRPPVLGQLGALHTSGELPDADQTLTWFAFEVTPANQGRTVNWHRTSFSLPRCLIRDPVAAEAARGELAVVQQVAQGLQKAVAREQVRGQDRNRALKRARDGLSRLLWDFHSGAAQAFLRVANDFLNDPTDVDAFREEFRQSLRRLVNEARRRTVVASPPNQRWLSAQDEAEFGKAINSILSAEGGKR